MLESGQKFILCRVAHKLPNVPGFLNNKSSHTCSNLSPLTGTSKRHWFNLAPNFEALINHIINAWVNMTFIIYYKNTVF